MALRTNFVETVTAPLGIDGDLIPVSGLATTVYLINPDGTEGAQATAYAARTGSTAASTMNTDASGKISYWLDPGEYNIHFSDPQSPPRVAAFVRGYSSNPAATVVSGAGTTVPLGAITSYAGTADPQDADGVTRWLICDGRAISRTTYAGAFAAIGIAFGSGDGTNTFNIPDFRGRVAVGAGTGSGLTARALATKGGEETHALIAAEIPSGTVTLNDPGHGHTAVGAGTGMTLNDPGHLHNLYNKQPAWSGTATLKSGYEGTSSSTAGVDAFALNGAYTMWTDTNVQGAGTGVTLSDPWHTHTINGNTTGITLTDRGGNGAHNNMQPYLVVNRIIKVL